MGKKRKNPRGCCSARQNQFLSSLPGHPPPNLGLGREKEGEKGNGIKGASKGRRGRGERKQQQQKAQQQAGLGGLLLTPAAPTAPRPRPRDSWAAPHAQRNRRARRDPSAASDKGAEASEECLESAAGSGPLEPGPPRRPRARRRPRAAPAPLCGWRRAARPGGGGAAEAPGPRRGHAPRSPQLRRRGSRRGGPGSPPGAAPAPGERGAGRPGAPSPRAAPGPAAPRSRPRRGRPGTGRRPKLPEGGGRRPRLGRAESSASRRVASGRSWPRAAPVGGE